MLASGSAFSHSSRLTLKAAFSPVWCRFCFPACVIICLVCHVYLCILTALLLTVFVYVCSVLLQSEAKIGVKMKVLMWTHKQNKNSKCSCLLNTSHTCHIACVSAQFASCLLTINISVNHLSDSLSVNTRAASTPLSVSTVHRRVLQISEHQSNTKGEERKGKNTELQRRPERNHGAFRWHRYLIRWQNKNSKWSRRLCERWTAAWGGFFFSFYFSLTSVR